MLEGRFVIVVVPAFREETHIRRVIQTMPVFVDHIIVVDDGSDDQTNERARAAALSGRVCVLRHGKRRGVGAAIATGYASALELGDGVPETGGIAFECKSNDRGHGDGRRASANDEDVIAVMAGDGQMHPDDLGPLTLPIIRGEADYVKGNRFGEPTVRRTMGLPRWLGGQVFSRLTSLAVGQPISDSQCGFTAISRRAILGLDLTALWPSFGYPNDLLGQLAARGARIREVPVRPVYGSEISKLRLRHLPPIFFLIARAAARRAGSRTGIHAAERVTRTTEVTKKELRTGSAVSS